MKAAVSRLLASLLSDPGLPCPLLKECPLASTPPLVWLPLKEWLLGSTTGLLGARPLAESPLTSTPALVWAPLDDWLLFSAPDLLWLAVREVALASTLAPVVPWLYAQLRLGMLLSEGLTFRSSDACLWLPEPAQNNASDQMYKTSAHQAKLVAAEHASNPQTCISNVINYL